MIHGNAGKIELGAVRITRLSIASMMVRIAEMEAWRGKARPHGCSGVGGIENGAPGSQVPTQPSQQHPRSKYQLISSAASPSHLEHGTSAEADGWTSPLHSYLVHKPQGCSFLRISLDTSDVYCVGATICGADVQCGVISE